MALVINTKARESAKPTLVQLVRSGADIHKLTAPEKIAQTLNLSGGH